VHLIRPGLADTRRCGARPSARARRCAPARHEREKNRGRWQQQCGHFIREVFTSAVVVQEWELAQQSKPWSDDPWATTVDSHTERSDSAQQFDAKSWLAELRRHVEILPLMALTDFGSVGDLVARRLRVSV
jgi:hypothetical protein